MTIAEIKFHIGHVYELQQKYHDARRMYDQVLSDDSKTNEIASATHTTLGKIQNIYSLRLTKFSKILQMIEISMKYNLVKFCEILLTRNFRCRSK